MTTSLKNLSFWNATMTIHLQNMVDLDVAVQRVSAMIECRMQFNTPKIYFCDNPVYNKANFERRSRISRERFIEIWNELEDSYEFYNQKKGRCRL